MALSHTSAIEGHPTDDERDIDTTPTCTDRADEEGSDLSEAEGRGGSRPARAWSVAAMTVGLGATSVWLGWRCVALALHPVSVVFLAAELAGIAAAVAIGVGLVRSDVQREVYAIGDHGREVHTFAHAVADLVGRTRADDLHRAVRSAIRAAPRRRPQDWSDAAIAAVLAEGPRRLLLVVTITVGLLVGTAPFPLPPWWAATSAAVGAAGLALASVALGRGRIRFGDRHRWSYGSIGEVLSRDEVAGHAPRSWIGAVGVTVVLCFAVALRGMSDRWTHGLPEMSYEQRAVGFAVAVAFVVGALHTIKTTARPGPVDAPLISRRLEEATARQTLLVAAVGLGIVGLVAGLVPAHSDEDVPRSVPAPDVVVFDAEGGLDEGLDEDLDE